MLVHKISPPIALIALVLEAGSPRAPAQEPARPSTLSCQPPAPAAVRDQSRRRRAWNDRTTPRKTLETFYFAITGYDRSPRPDRQRDRLPRPGRARPRDARARRGPAGPPARVHPEPPGHPALQRPRPPRRATAWCWTRWTGSRSPWPASPTADGGSTPRPSGGSGGCGSSPRTASARPRRRGPRWPRAGPTRRPRSARSPGPRWAGATSRLAARCLDLRDVPPKLRASEGAEMARKLAFVMQRCGVHVLAGGAQRPRRLPLRLALQPSRPDHARAGPPARGPGRLAVHPRHAAQPRRPGRGLPPQDPRPAVRDRSAW